MARRAPAVERSVAILNHLAAHPGRRYTLSEIARDLRLNKATLHAILNALTEAGYLVRDQAAKSYGLGPALIAVGNSARGTSPAADYALPEMQALTDELGLDCVASAAIHDEIVILERTGTPRPFGINVMPGQRLPLRPPLGTVFVAWSGKERVERWLAKLGPQVPRKSIDHHRRTIATVRARGYSVGLEGSAPHRTPRARPAAAGQRDRSLEEGVRSVRLEEYALLELEARTSYRANHIGAPVFGPDGEVALALFLIGFTGPLTGEQVDHFASRLRAACARVTKGIHGREPER